MQRVITKRIPIKLCLAALSLTLTWSASAQEDKDKDKAKDSGKAAGVPARREESMRASMTAKVTAINPEKREITLKGAEGKEKTLTVDKEVKRFNEIKVGDTVSADYYVSLALELREPTAEEKANPLVDETVEAKTPDGATPGAGALRKVQAVATVEEMDPTAKTVTIKGPRGKTVDVAVKDPAIFQKVKKGDSVMVTFTEALAVSLEKKE